MISNFSNIYFRNANVTSKRIDTMIKKLDCISSKRINAEINKNLIETQNDLFIWDLLKSKKYVKSDKSTVN